MLRNLVDCHHQELDVLAKVMGSTPADIMERSRLEEVHEKNKAARAAAREELLKVKKDEEKKNAEETIIEQKEKEEIENTTDMLLEKVDFLEHMKSRQTVHNFVLMYRVLCKLLQGVAHSQMCSLRFVSKMKKNLIGDTQIKFVKKVKKFSDTIATQYKNIKATENRRSRHFVTLADPTGILLDPQLRSILLADLDLCNKQNKYFDKQMTELANLVCGTESTVIPSSDRARRPIK